MKSAPAAVMAAGDGTAAKITPMAGGGGVISPLPLIVGGKRRSRKLSKKVLKMLKKMGPAKVAKLVKKGGNTMSEDGTAMGGRRRRSGRKTRRHSRRH